MKRRENQTVPEVLPITRDLIAIAGEFGLDVTAVQTAIGRDEFANLKEYVSRMPWASKRAWKEAAARAGVPYLQWVLLPYEGRKTLSDYAKQQRAIAFYGEHPELKPKRKPARPRKERVKLDPREAAERTKANKRGWARKNNATNPAAHQAAQAKYQKEHREQRNAAQRKRREARRSAKQAIAVQVDPPSAVCTDLDAPQLNG